MKRRVASNLRNPSNSPILQTNQHKQQIDGMKFDFGIASVQTQGGMACCNTLFATPSYIFSFSGGTKAMAFSHLALSSARNLGNWAGVMVFIGS